MERINVLVAGTRPDVETEGIASAVANRDDMTLVAGRVVSMSEVGAQLDSIPRGTRCALVLAGSYAETDEPAQRWLADRAGLVILRIDVIDHAVRIALRDVSLDLDSLLAALKGLVERAGSLPGDRTARFQLKTVSDWNDRAPETARSAAKERPLLYAAMEWIHALLHSSATNQPGGNGDFPGLTLSAKTVAELLDARPAHTAPDVADDVARADAALTRALVAADANAEPIAAAVRSFRLTAVEFRVLLLALAPELDPRYQRCIGLLLDDLGHRVGTLGLCSALIGEPSKVRRDLSHAGNLARWRVVEGRAGGLPAADEPLRLDPALAGWLLGERSALDHDVRVRRTMRLSAWPGADLFDRKRDDVRASTLVAQLQTLGDVQWLLFAGSDVSRWRALLERGAELQQTIPIRADAARVVGLDVVEIEESGVRLGRLARLTGRPLVVDTTATETTAQEEDALRLLFAAIGGTGCRTGVICSETPRIVRLLGSSACASYDSASFHSSALSDAVRAAGRVLDLGLDDKAADELARRYPLSAEAVEQAMQLARAKRLATDDEPKRRERFSTACQDVAAEGVSRLADRIQPAFALTDVVLPADRTRQLNDIVDSVRLAAKVLDEWHFRDQLPYGRGVSALFHGASGTGKTMASHGVAAALDIQILRIDLSRVVSKYIGDTEKNIDRVFLDAQRSGAAIVIDEADALLGKRSEVKDAHDRYANIEVAYLLQRMEAFEGLAILTTNMRQNLDPAFLRRLRFIIDFPRPDVDAREKIWRRCFPAGSHVLDDAAFRQLARKIELTGGHIRQITLRAAFTAAASDSRIGLEHVAYASSAEFAKLGMPAVEFDLPRCRRAA